MSRVITVSKFWVPPDRFDQVSQLWIETKRIQDRHRGCLASTVWKDLDLTERFAFVSEFQDHNAATSAFEAIETAGLIVQTARALPSTPDIDQIRVYEEDGVQLAKTSIGDLLSTSVRRSEPGFGPVIEEETKQIFDSLKFLDGYLGALQGANVSLQEELYGFVFWSDRAGFEASLPAKSLYEVKLYERIL